MKYLIILLIIILSPSIYGQSTDSTIILHDSLTFTQKLDLLAAKSTYGVTMFYNNIDTINNTVDLKINFHFSKKAIKILKENLAKNKDSIVLIPKKNKADKYNTTIIFRNVKLIWNSQSNSFITTNKKLFTLEYGEIGDINDSIVFELKPTTAVNKISFFFISKDNQWYFFQFKGSQLSCSSSNIKFSESIKNTKHGIGTLKSKNGLFYYYFCPSLSVKKYLRVIDFYIEKEDLNK